MNRPIHTPATLNGLDPAAMEGIGAAIAAAPEQGHVALEVESTWSGATRIHCRAPGFELGGERIDRPHAVEVDEPSELLGSDAAPNPQQLLFSALASCLSITFVDHATMAGVRIEALEAQVRGELDLRGVLGLDPEVAPGFPKLRCRLKVRADASRAQLEELLATATALSPTYWQLARSADIDTELVIDG